MLRLTVLFLSICLSFSLHAVQRYLSAVDESEWSVKSSPIYCELRHPISHYGDGRFVYSSGGELAFQLHTLEAAPRDSAASLLSVSPFWREPYNNELAQLTLNKGRMPVYVGGRLAKRMLYELQAGRQPTFHYKDWADFQDDVYVTVSSANFHQQLDDFQRCMAKALPYGSEGVKDVAVYFDNNRHRLTKQQKKRLDEIVMFASLDKGMKIQLTGHADSRGRRAYNKALSNKRTRAVKQYLLSKGVSPEQISLLAVGESRPLDSNRTDSGRSRNRRVDVAIKR